MMVTAQTIIGLQMDVAEARRVVVGINHHLNRVAHHAQEARSLIYDLHAREGWKALGYPSWRQCVMAEFEQSSSSVYRHLAAALVEMELSPMGEDLSAVSERTLRPLTKHGLDEDARRFAWQVARSVIGPEGKLPTPGIVEAVVEGLEDIIRTGAYQDSEGEQRLYGQQMSADLTARIREQKLKHKQHIQRMDKERDYIVGGIQPDKIERISGGRMGKFWAKVLIEIPDPIQREKLSIAFSQGKPIYCSLWTED